MDWRDRFRAPTILGARVAADAPDRGVVITDKSGSFQAFAWNRETGDLTQVTKSAGAVLEAAISADGDWIYALVESVDGAEIGHMHAFPFDGGPSRDLTPDLSDYPLFVYLPLEGGVAGLGGVDGRPSLVIARDERTEVVNLPGAPLSAAVSPDGSWAAVSTSTPGRGLIPQAVILELPGGEVREVHQETQVGALHGDSLAVSVIDGDWMRPGLIVDGTFEPIDLEIPGDVKPLDWSSDGTTLLLAQSYRSSGALFLYELGTGLLTELPNPDGAFHPWASPSLVDNETALAIWSGPGTPWRALELKPGSWSNAVDVGADSNFPAPVWEEFEFASTDGSTGQGWLLRPEGKCPYPTILHTHGGPSSVAAPGFSPFHGAWVDAGFAVATVNYRGSTTFGTSYREALTGDVGRPDVDDVVAARRHLIETGVADPERIIMNGYSYGGYLTLQTLGVHPNGWAAGIAGAPIADWTIMAVEQNDALKSYARSLFGGDPEDVPDLYRRASPRTYAADYRAPILITQPENDSRTPLKPVQVFVDDLERHGKDIELYLMPGGHGGVGKENAIAMMERWLQFAREAIK